MIKKGCARMSKSVLQGAKFRGLIKVSEDGLVGMISLRCDLKSVAVARGVRAALGLDLPDVRAIVYGRGGRAIAWMSPDEVLVLCDYTAVAGLVKKLDKALKGLHFMAVNVSDARAVFTLSGAGVRDVLAKGTPFDMSKLGVGEVARSRLGQVAVAFWLSDEGTARLVCFRSVGEHVFEWLRVAADKTAGVGFYN